ncbi:MAG: response regulator [Lachnospiraceae bacterium]|jgi:YesN/AraC family two-component response regulator|nr:response regulator [Lachnospiraceae bacterium]MBO4787285.1 response regulator [Lachnospiraceae bacterium]MBQ2031491.1 response regulator [Lachnospiraceae bacterium]MBQ2558498.1 response regulator [Lachnospiraceae bacterium]MBQ3979278.1 response regulator [Lachnospiraceae bacterium]
MYRVMIIDDEPAIYRLLSKTIDWAAYNMEIVGTAASGIEAINTIDDLQPDVCFVDVQMPFMDGIEFSKLAKVRYPDMAIVVLSAYDEFQYARECIGIGVFDYRLKPIEKKDINDTLRRLFLYLNNQRAARGEEPEVSSCAKASYSLEKVKEYIQTRYFEVDMNVSKVAKAFGFNQSYLSRKFKSETGERPVDYLLACRMEHAKRAALAGKMPYQVAKEIGIPDPNYFARCFKKYTGMAYSVYQQSAKKDT